MKSECEICGTHATSNEPLLLLEAVGIGGARVGEPVALCAACVAARQVASWPRKGREGRGIEQGLGAHPHAGRYSYLEDRGHIHLLRLRAEWIRAHAAS